MGHNETHSTIGFEMNDIKELLKRKTKQYAPHAIAVASTVALGAVLWKYRGRLLSMPDAALDRLKDGETAFYRLKDGTYLIVAALSTETVKS